MNIDRTLVNIDVVAPNAVQQSLSGENTSRPLHQELQQSELGGAELDLAAAAMNAVAFSIELNASRGENRVDMGRFGSSQQRANPR